MKKHFFTAALAVLAVAACSKENLEEQGKETEEVRGIEVSANVSQATKTSIDGVNVFWAKGDRIGFVADDNSVIDGSSFYAIKDEFDGKESATITVPIKEGVEVTDETQIAFTAYYPYSETTSDGTQVIEIAAEQDGQTGKWGQMSAKFSGTKAELVESGLTFKHDCAYIDFQFKSSELNGCPVTKVMLTSLDEDKHFTGKTILKVDGLSTESYNHVSVSDPVAELSTEWQGKLAVVAPVDLTGTKVKIDITYTKDGASLTQTKVIAGSNLQAGHKVTLKLNLDKTDFNVISFEDSNLGELLVSRFDTDKDGFLTIGEAAAVTKEMMKNFIDNNWPKKGVSSFHEFQYFTGLTSTPSWQTKTIRKITLPNSITVISDYSFMKLGLREINNTSQVTVVGNNAFNYCTALKSIDLSAVTEIGDNAFCMVNGLDNNTYLESVGETKNLADIGESAFKGCYSLKSINLSNLKSVGKNAFSGCKALTEINSSLSTLSEIPEGLFADCLELEANIKLPKVIGNSAFGNCSKIVFDLSDFEKVKSIGQRAFLGCQNITGNLCLKEIATLGNQAFKNTKITSVVMTGAPLEKIDDHCFNGCTSLKTVTISENTTTIGRGAFYGCENISEYHILSKNPATVYSDTFAGTDNYVIYVPKGCVETYKAAEVWSTYADRIQEEL